MIPTIHLTSWGLSLLEEVSLQMKTLISVIFGDSVSGAQFSMSVKEALQLTCVIQSSAYGTMRITSFMSVIGFTA